MDERTQQAWEEFFRDAPRMLEWMRSQGFPDGGDSGLSAVEAYVQELHREIRMLQQEARCWRWLKERNADLLYFSKLGQWRVVESGKMASRRILGSLCDSPEEAVQSAMDEEQTK